MERILIIYGKSQYDSTRIFLREMQGEWERLGAIVDVLDSYAEEDYLKKRKTLQNKSFDVIVTMNGMLLEKDSLLGSLLLKDSVLYVTMLMDHPLIHHERLATSYSNCLVFSPDRNHVKYLEKYYPNIQKVGFLAHGGCGAKCVIPYEKRSISVSFMGSYSNPQEILNEMERYPNQMKLLLKNCADYLMYHTEETIEDAIKKFFSAFGMEIPLSEFPAIVSEFRIVDRYIRSYYRDQVIRILVENGIPVDVYGDGWENMQLAEGHFLQIHGRVNYQKSLELVADSKISLNVMPWFKDGSHDRVFSAMLCGSVCLTDPSRYLEEVCHDRENILFYNLGKLETLPQMVTSIIEDLALGKKIAMEGKKIAEQRHTWKERGKEVYQYLSD